MKGLGVAGSGGPGMVVVGSREWLGSRIRDLVGVWGLQGRRVIESLGMVGSRVVGV